MVGEGGHPDVGRRPGGRPRLRLPGLGGRRGGRRPRGEEVQPHHDGQGQRQGREGVELYPTLEVGTASYRTAAYLAHNAIAIQFTEEDLDQALSSNFVTKVIYLPDPEFQGDAISGIDIDRVKSLVYLHRD